MNSQHGQHLGQTRERQQVEQHDEGLHYPNPKVDASSRRRHPVGHGKDDLAGWRINCGKLAEVDSLKNLC